MRLFVALAVPAPALAEVASMVERAREMVGEQPDLDPGRVRWIPRERMHVTLAFLGEVPARRVEPLSIRLARAAAQAQPLRLRVGGAGRFGDRVLYARMRGDLPALSRLAQSVSAAALHSGLEVSARPFEPHITLARSRAADFGGLLTALAEHEGSWWVGQSIELVSSRLAPRPRHETVQSWLLGAQGAAGGAQGAAGGAQGG